MYGHYTQLQYGFILGFPGCIPAHVGNTLQTWALSIWTDSRLHRQEWMRGTHSDRLSRPFHFCHSFCFHFWSIRDRSPKNSAAARQSSVIIASQLQLREPEWKWTSRGPIESRATFGLYQHYLHCKDDRTTIFLFPSSFLNLILLAVGRFCHGCQHLEACSLCGCT